jgi:hypothetical protein
LCPVIDVSCRKLTAQVEGLDGTSAEAGDRASSFRVILRPAAHSLEAVNREVELCAEAVAAWHAAWLTSFGQRSVWDEDAWRALDAPHFIYFAGITLRAAAGAEAVAAAPGTLCDSWSVLDLAPFGFEERDSEAWFLRDAGPLPVDDLPAEFEVIRVSRPAEVEELEAVSVRGFDNEGATVEPASVHPPTILGDPRMALWLGRAAGKAVSAAMSYRTDRAVGVFGVTTVASARRRGYASALTRAAMLADTGLPSILAPSHEAERMYERLGYRRVGELRKWVKADPAR